jgi:hypothetical protein
MKTTVNSAARTQGNAHAEPVKIVKRIGSTTFVVAVHFSQTDRETIQDKVKRLIEQEVGRSA